MKKLVCIFLLILTLAGCGNEKSAEQGTTEIQEEAGQAILHENPSEDSQKTNGMARIIEDHTFEIALDNWGEVTFAAIAPDGEKEKDVTFKLLKNGQETYTFPEKGTDNFSKVLAVAFKDYNGDAKKDVIAIVQYKDGENVWNQAKVFLQENADNMFYLDYDLGEYLLERETENGPAFYRDLFLEEYLQKQGLTDNVSSVMGTWKDYAEYVAGLNGEISIDRQIEIFAGQVGKWGADIEYADDLYCFALTELDYDGMIDLIVSNCGGTGSFSYNRFYEINSEGNMEELGTNFIEGNSQVDIITDEATVYSSFSADGIKDYYIFGDFLKAGPDEYHEDIRALYIEKNVVMEMPLANKDTLYGGADYTGKTVYTDYKGEEITEEDYDNFAQTYFEKLGLQKKTASFGWMDVKDLQGLSTDQIIAMLSESYQNFEVK
jgi:hypothetical protein